MSTEFKHLVSSSVQLQNRWGTITDQLADQIQSDFGVAVTKSQLAELECVRLAVLSGDTDLLATFDVEVQRIPAVRTAVKSQELISALSNVEDPAHKQSQEEWKKLSIQQRMSRARELDAAKPKAAAPAPLTGADRAKAIRDIQTLRGGARIAAARKAGLA